MNLTLLWSSLWWRDFVCAATLGEIAESKGTPRFTLLFLTKFPSTCDKEFSRLLGACQSASKSGNSDRCKHGFPHLHWKQEYPIYHQILFHRSETFLFNFIFLLESFSSKPHKTQPAFVALRIRRWLVFDPFNWSFQKNKQTNLTAVRVLGQFNFRVKWTPISLQVTSESALIKNNKLHHRHG